MIISKYVVNILNLYVFGILAGLTGAFWSYVITSSVNERDKILKMKKWYSQKDYSSLMRTLSKKAEIYIFIILVELFIIYLLKLY